MKQVIIISLLATIGCWSAGFAQNTPSQSEKLTADQQDAVDAMIAMDPKLSAEEIEHIKLAVKGAPVKAEPISDPRMAAPPQPVHAPWKAQPIEERDDVTQRQPVPAVSASGGANTQPVPEEPKNATARGNAGASSDQPVPPVNQGVKTGLERNGPKHQPPAEPERK